MTYTERHSRIETVSSPAVPRVSAVISTFNRGDAIGVALNSALRQTLRPAEVIIIDRGSTDDTAERIGAVDTAVDGAAIRYYRTAAAMGQAEARNFGIALAQGDLVAFLDPGDEWLPEKTARQAAMFAAGDDRLGLVYCGIEDPAAGWPGLGQTPFRRGELFDLLRVRNVLGLSAVMVRRAVFDRIGGFDRRLRAHEDWDLWLRLSRRYLVDFVADPGVRRHSGGAGRPAGENQMAREGQTARAAREAFLANAIIFRRYNRPVAPRRARASYLARQAHALASLNRYRLASRCALKALLAHPVEPTALRVLAQMVNLPPHPAP